MVVTLGQQYNVGEKPIVITLGQQYNVGEKPIVILYGVVVVFTLKKLSDLYSVPSNIRTGPTDANAFRGHRLTTRNRVDIVKNQEEIKGPRRNKRTQKSQHTRANWKKNKQKTEK